MIVKLPLMAVVKSQGFLLETFHLLNGISNFEIFKKKGNNFLKFFVNNLSYLVPTVTMKG